MHSAKQWYLISILVTVLTGTSAGQPVAATIDAAHTGQPITKLIFGGFMEPATTQVWAEMLSDRKFFNEINSKPAASPTGGFGRRGRNAVGCPPAPTSLW
jgi:alpha-N-arabinofuranosidase